MLSGATESDDDFVGAVKTQHVRATGPVLDEDSQDGTQPTSAAADKEAADEEDDTHEAGTQPEQTAPDPALEVKASKHWQPGQGKGRKSKVDAVQQLAAVTKSLIRCPSCLHHDLGVFDERASPLFTVSLLASCSGTWPQLRSNGCAMCALH